jgi:hypothetical protein
MMVRNRVSRRLVLSGVATLAALAAVGVTAGGAAAATVQKPCPTFRVVIHERGGFVNWVMGCGCWGVGALRAFWSWAEGLQSSIRSRGADQSVLRGSGAQSSGRPS